ncbi:ATP-binding protein [Seleniivibrio woodruffii]|uniref:ATP-binding protein n=1 Tax=Seleniivibrio woodruffii TaxID=1078050 RepID=UPI0024094F98|nr:4Fe-4S binding protein [Seleniivibrio woodruffii]
MIKTSGSLEVGFSPVKPESRHCIAMYHKNAGCRDCLESCDHNAIHIGRPGSGISIDSSLCSGCEKCIASCSYGVFKRSGQSESQWCRNILQMSDNRTVRILCMKKDGKSACLGSIHFIHMLFWLIKGTEKLVLVSSDCEHCENNQGLTMLKQQTLCLNDFWSSITGSALDIYSDDGGFNIEAHRSPFLKNSRLNSMNNIGRRDFFKAVGRELVKSVSEVVDSITVQENSKIDFSEKRVMSQRMVLFRSIMSDLRHKIIRPLRYNRKVPLGIIDIDHSSCTRCGLCIRLCPTGALVSDQKYDLVHNSQLCCGCGVCEKVCSNKCLRLSKWAYLP